MKKISMLEMRTESQRIMRDLARGEKMTLEYRGKAVAILSPILSEEGPQEGDPLRNLGGLAQEGLGSLEEFSIDDLLYGPNSDIH
jgi:antitoxin (DNA-binding transcriptional repressor) of toxin-antitoxin stability system